MAVVERSTINGIFEDPQYRDQGSLDHLEVKPSVLKKKLEEDLQIKGILDCSFPTVVIAQLGGKVDKVLYEGMDYFEELVNALLELVRKQLN